MTSPNPSAVRRRLLTALKWGVSLGVLAWLLSSIPKASILESLSKTQPAWVLLAFALNLGGVWVLAWRWKLLLGEREVRVRELFGWSLVGIGAGLFLPSSAAADGVKAVLFGRASGQMGRSLVSTVAGRILGMASMLAQAVVGVLLWPQARELLSPERLAWIAVVATIGGGASTLFYLFLRRWIQNRPGGRWTDRIRSAFSHVDEVRSDLPRLFAALGLSILNQSMGFLAVWALFAAVGTQVPPGPIFVLMPLVLLGSVAPISLGGMGVREGILVALFTHFGLAEAGACLSSSVLGYVVLGSMGALGGLWWLLFGRTAVARSSRQAPAA